MVLEHARDDLFIEGKAPAYSKIKKPENKQLQLEGTVDITDASDGTNFNTGNLTLSGVDINDHVKKSLNHKDPVLVAANSNETLANIIPGYSIDNVTLAAGDRILLRQQTDASENGIYGVNSSGAATRTSDLTTGVDSHGVHVHVIEGDIHAGETYRVSNPTSTSTVDTHDLNWVGVFYEKNPWKGDCIVVATSPITLAGAQTIDGVSVSADNERVLVTAQADAKTNGIYLTGSSWSRPSDMGDGNTANATVWVREGTVYSDTVWTNTANTGKIGTDNITMKRVSDADPVSTVTQITSGNTAVALNSRKGVITTVTLSSSSFNFTVNCTKCLSSSLILVSVMNYAGTGEPVARVNSVANGSFNISVQNAEGIASFDAVMKIGFFIH